MHQGIAQGLQFAGASFAKTQQADAQSVQSRQGAVSQVEQDMGQNISSARRGAQETAKSGIQVAGSVYQAAVAASKA